MCNKKKKSGTERHQPHAQFDEQLMLDVFILQDYALETTATQEKCLHEKELQNKI